MKYLGSILAGLLALLIFGLIALNWSTLNAAAPLDLAVAQIQAPLGVVLLGLAGILVLLFFVAYLRTQISSLVETRRLLKEIQRIHELADKAEASRIENLRQFITAEFAAINRRFDTALATPATPATIAL